MRNASENRVGPIPPIKHDRIHVNRSNEIPLRWVSSAGNSAASSRGSTARMRLSQLHQVTVCFCVFECWQWWQR